MWNNIKDLCFSLRFGPFSCETIEYQLLFIHYTIYTLYIEDKLGWYSGRRVAWKGSSKLPNNLRPFNKMTSLPWRIFFSYIFSFKSNEMAYYMSPTYVQKELVQFKPMANKAKIGDEKNTHVPWTRIRLCKSKSNLLIWKLNKSWIKSQMDT